MILLLISFVAGVLTVLAPCILPLLPVIIGGSLSGDGKDFQRKKVFTIVAALSLSVIVFTLLLKVSTLFIEVPEYVWKWISGGIVIILGIVTLFPSLWEGQWLARISTKSNILLGKGNQKKSFWGDVIIGASLGPIFSTCSPTYFIVLATVLPAQPIVGLTYLLAYTAGLSLALFLIALIGQKIMSKLNLAADTHGWIKRSLGLLFIIVGLAIVTGFDKKAETAILNSGFFDITKVEQKLLELTEPESAINKGTSQIETESKAKIDKSRLYKLAPEISTPDGFVNTEGQPITLEELRGKVVILEVWTYSCINCQRTIPYLKDWYEKYHDQGLEIVGLHTPEFAFEKLQSNVEAAVKNFGIKYPVVLDNDYSTWNDYGNKYWPRKYLIDIDGYIIYDHIGEGAYEETEKEIQKALAERSERMGMSKEMVIKPIVAPDNVVTVEPGMVNSPEVYFGAKRNTLLANGKVGAYGLQDLTVPASRKGNQLYLGGTWDFTGEYTENKSTAVINFNYDAKRVYFVGGSDEGVEIDVYQDDNFVKTINVKAEQLYELIEGDSYGQHSLELRVKGAGLKAFTLTFG